MMFSKGTWTLLKLKQGEDGTTPIDSFKAQFAASKSTYIPLVAISKAIHEQTKAVGVSPFSLPRLGDNEDVEFYFEPKQKGDDAKYTVEPMDTFLTNYGPFDEWEMDGTDLKHPDLSIRLPLAPFWKPNLDEWQFCPGVFGLWFMVFEYIDALDANSKKESLAYDFGAPFKLQTAEVKKQIQDQIIDANTFTRKHHQIVLDFNMGYVWVNTGSKAIIHEVIAFLGDMDLAVDHPELADDFSGDDFGEILGDLYDKSSIAADVVRRLEEVKLHGPEGVQPDEDATKEKILKAFCAFTETDAFHIGMATPMAIRLAPNFLTTTGAKTTYEAVELLCTYEEARIEEANLMFCEFGEKRAKNGDVRKVLSKRFSIHMTPNMYFTGDDAPPGLILKGINVENFKQLVKIHAKATDAAPSIKDYWSIYYDALKVAVFSYFSVLKDLKG